MIGVCVLLAISKPAPDAGVSAEAELSSNPSPAPALASTPPAPASLPKLTPPAPAHRDAAALSAPARGPEAASTHSVTAAAAGVAGVADPGARGERGATPRAEAMRQLKLLTDDIDSQVWEFGSYKVTHCDFRRPQKTV